jgi:6-phosphogluconolactonase
MTNTHSSFLARKIVRASAAGFFLGLLLMTVATSSYAKSKSGPKYVVYVGTYTDHGSKGIYAYDFDSVTGRLEARGLQAEAANPSFQVVSANQRFLYSVSEVGDYKGEKSGALLAYQIDSNTSKLTPLNQVATKGAGPCHLSIDKTGKFVLVANYDSGSVVVSPVGVDGRLVEASGFVQHKGAGVDPDRQTGPHAHFIESSADNRFALAADLGLDEILVYQLDSSKGVLSPATPAYAKVKGGSGPRHFVFHPNGRFLYLLNEMASAVTVFSYDAANGGLQEKQTVSALPKDFSGKSDAAEIQIDAAGKFLYTSNRGSDSVTVFAIAPDSGTLSVVQNISTGGKTPRHFTLDPSGKYLLAANQESNNIVTFTVDRRTGKLTKASEVSNISAPVCLTFVELK